MALGEPRTTGDGRLRYFCERCGEHWTEDNIDECVHCLRDVCPRCAGIYDLEGRKRREWWCNICRERSGLANVEWVPNPKWKPKQHTPKTLSILNLKASVLRDWNSTFIDWSPDTERRRILRESLQILRFDVETDGKDFESAPAAGDGLADAGQARLIFTGRGIKKLERVVGEMQEWRLAD
jgi:hypothetical protein